MFFFVLMGTPLVDTPLSWEFLWPGANKYVNAKMECFKDDTKNTGLSPCFCHGEVEIIG